ncbi:MAG TPA: hypothetical protein VGA47_11975 [Candidatus Dormibacteraeota bacterium]
MSDQDDDLQLQALQRQLEDAFATTRPRPGFEDELWLRMQAKRPVLTRIRDAVGGLLGGIREVPAVPMAAVASVLVVVIGVGIFAYSGLGRGGGAGAPSSASLGDTKRNSGEYYGSFGPLPGPAQGATAPSTAFEGPARLVWSGQLNLSITTAPVFRYQEPSTNAADQFATGLGAALVDRPAGLLGSYRASTYTLTVHGTVQAPPASPAYFILANQAMPAIDAAGAAPQDLANIFLAQHSLAPQWSYTISVDTKSDPLKVVYERQFEVPGYGEANLVDSNGVRYGLEVDLSGRRPVLAFGLLPVSLDRADYRIISAGEAIRQAVTPSSAPPVDASPLPTVQLTQAQLAYVLVPAGDHSFYEPAFLFTGSFQLNGQTMVKRVLVPAVDPSQRTS